MNGFGAAAGGFHRGHRGDRKGSTGDRVQVARDTHHRERVAAVGGEFDFKAAVIKVKHLADVFTHGGVGGKFPNAGMVA